MYEVPKRKNKKKIKRKIKKIKEKIKRKLPELGGERVLVPLSADYLKLNEGMLKLKEDATLVYREIDELSDKMGRLNLSWIGSAHDAYLRRLNEDILEMQMRAILVLNLCELLREGISRYQQTEIVIMGIVGGLYNAE